MRRQRKHERVRRGGCSRRVVTAAATEAPGVAVQQQQPQQGKPQPLEGKGEIPCSGRYRYTEGCRRYQAYQNRERQQQQQHQRQPAPQEQQQQREQQQHGVCRARFQRSLSFLLLCLLVDLKQQQEQQEYQQTIRSAAAIIPSPAAAAVLTEHSAVDRFSFSRFIRRKNF
ncbi:hypothetical protein, conserved [Eimeria tenella]|uniref:Uncharacterized protein n=1 Tax=Eimeria tenella TaxID=5802 RepID=U6L056_EIMTE|nr:hypothetical protein, conserved [Eimeria tenella]CDJ42563.1 hypothetical protein, conserved [Eimeria tenella]|eukprot:XP_013233313.1 hypothetical protein, conserved [Eimeria tenella]